MNQHQHSGLADGGLGAHPHLFPYLATAVGPKVWDITVLESQAEDMMTRKARAGSPDHHLTP